MSTAVQLLLLVHAPVSRRTFYYFNAHEVVSGRHFLRLDYTLEMLGADGRWSAFLVVVLAVLLGFVLLLPLSIGVVLWRNRAPA